MGFPCDDTPPVFSPRPLLQLCPAALLKDSPPALSPSAAPAQLEEAILGFMWTQVTFQPFWVSQGQNAQKLLQNQVRQRGKKNNEVLQTRQRRQQTSSMKTCLLLPRKVRKEPELHSKENVVHSLHHSDTHPLDDSIIQPVRISLLSLPSIRPFKKIILPLTARVLTANSVPAEKDRNEYFLLPEKATSLLKKKRKLQRKTPALTLIQYCLPTPMQLHSLCRTEVPTC